MTAQKAAQLIEAAFAKTPAPHGVPNPRLSAEECRAAVGDYILLQPGDRRWILPQILLDFLAHRDRDDFKPSLRDLLSNLNVAAEPNPQHYEKMAERYDRAAVEEQRRLHEALLHRYQHDHEAFTTAEAAAIVAFLEVARSWLRSDLVDKVALRDWEQALNYWRQRSTGPA